MTPSTSILGMFGGREPEANSDSLSHLPVPR